VLGGQVQLHQTDQFLAAPSTQNNNHRDNTHGNHRDNTHGHNKPHIDNSWTYWDSIGLATLVVIFDMLRHLINHCTIIIIITRTSVN